MEDSTRRSRVETVPRSDRPWVAAVVHSPVAEAVGREIPVSDSVAFGRSTSANVDEVIEDSEMSRRHAVLRRVDGGLVIEDAGSTNGTFVDGARAASAVLEQNSIVRMGETVLVIDRASARTFDPSPFVGRSAQMIDAIEEMDRAASADVPVLFYGETGTGKELGAARIHAQSGRRGALVCVNCAAIPRELVESQLFGHRKGAFTGAREDAPGFFRAASEGTLFLDEVGEVSPFVQPKLLRVLSNGEFLPVGQSRPEISTARIVSATNVDLALAVEAGDFRQDLFARIAGVVITLAPLRERRRDVMAVLDLFLAEILPRRSVAFSASFAEKLLLHAWPMNVRELLTVAQRIAIRDARDRRLGADDADKVLNTAALRSTSDEGSRREPSRDDLERALSRFAGNVTDVASHFAKNPKQIYRWLKKHGLRPESFRD